MVVNKIYPRILPDRRAVWWHLFQGNSNQFFWVLRIRDIPQRWTEHNDLFYVRSNCTLTRNYGLVGKWPRLLSVDANKFYFFLSSLWHSMWYGVYLYALHAAYSNSHPHSVIEFLTGKIVCWFVVPFQIWMGKGQFELQPRTRLCIAHFKWTEFNNRIGIHILWMMAENLEMVEKGIYFQLFIWSNIPKFNELEPIESKQQHYVYRIQAALLFLVVANAHREKKKRVARVRWLQKNCSARIRFNVPTGDQHIIINDIFYNVNYIINHNPNMSRLFRSPSAQKAAEEEKNHFHYLLTLARLSGVCACVSPSSIGCDRRCLCNRRWWLCLSAKSKRLMNKRIISQEKY